MRCIYSERSEDDFDYDNNIDEPDSDSDENNKFNPTHSLEPHLFLLCAKARRLYTEDDRDEYAI